MTDDLQKPLFALLKQLLYKDGKFRTSSLEIITLIFFTIKNLFEIINSDRSLRDTFFDNNLTLITVGMVATVMVLYRLFWIIFEILHDDNLAFRSQRPLEQLPRFAAIASLIFGLEFFASSPKIFLFSLVSFYVCLAIWQYLISPEFRKNQGGMTFHLFGLACATGFCFIALNLHAESQVFFTEVLPRNANDALSADVVRRSFGGRQTNNVYLMGAFAGAMTANAILALLSILSGRRQG